LFAFKIRKFSFLAQSELTCEELRLTSIRVAQNLTKLGIVADDVIGLICSNSNIVTSLLHGCILIGAPINPLDVSFNKNDIRHLFSQTKPKLVICDAKVYEIVKLALNGLENTAKIFITNGEIPDVPKVDELLMPTGTEDDFVAPKFSQPADEKIVAILCSSGTTGSPKGVLTTHAGCLKAINGFKYSPPSVSLNFSPIFWGSGFFPQIFASFAVNDRKIMTNRGFSVEFLDELIERHQVSSVMFPPSQLAMTLRSEIRNSWASLRGVYCAGSIVTLSLRKQFKARFPNIKLGIFYGMTEVSVAVTKPQEDVTESLSVGSMIFSNNIVKIVNENEENLGVGEAGEIRVKPQMKFHGYINNPEATVNAIDSDGFIKTGDIGFFDEKNALHVVDRLKEVMRYKGYNSTPSEIESVIEELEGVEIVSVFGIYDPVATDLPTAVVVKLENYENILTEQKIIDHVASKLSEHKRLHGGVFFMTRDELPMTPSGKIQKRFLKEIVMKKLVVESTYWPTS
jgi:4-coumarate--CoA ligase